MDSSYRMPDPDPGYSKYLAGMLLAILIALGVQIGLPKLSNHLDKDLAFTERALRESAELKQEYEFVWDITQTTRPSRRGSSMSHVNDRGGYYTFDVRGYIKATDKHRETKMFRVHFSIVHGERTITWIEPNAPYLLAGERPIMRPAVKSSN